MSDHITSSSARSMPNIPGYVVSSVIGTGAGSVVYRGTRDDGGESFAIKVLEGNDVDAGLRFRQEAAALARLNHPGLVKVIETGEAEGISFMVMELVEGQTLATALEDGPISEAQTVSLAKGLAGALSEVHRHGLVHRDLKPSNVIVTHDGQPKIVDFGFVGMAQTEDKDLEANTKQVVGTFLYAPPEQTGMLSRPVDGRSDLYSLGCVLFECLIGRPPFEADTVAELLKQHAAVRPKTVHDLNKSLGPVLSSIVDKLLAKDPDDRYQSAAGLLADIVALSLLEASRMAGEEDDKTLLGRNDSRLRFAAEIPLVGREKELDRLLRAWERARSGHGGVVQIEGEPGMGKTRLARELLELAQDDGALVLMGKAQKAEQAPLGAIREAIDAYMTSLRDLPDAERDVHTERTKRAAGEVAGIIRRLTPGMGRFFADADDIPPLHPAEEEQRRFYDRVADFAADLSREHGGMLLVIDDIQWADLGTVEFLARLSNLVAEAPLLVLTTARNDPESEEATNHVIETLGQDRVELLFLGRLNDEAVEAFLSSYLGGRRLDEAVTSALMARSGGNPFALGEYLRSLLDEGMLRPTARGWVAETERFGEVDLPDDVITVLVDRVAKLDRDAQDVLRTAAVAGFTFDGPTLVRVQVGEDEVRRGLNLSLQANLIEATMGESYRFIHDRVHEALLTEIDVEELADIHQALAEAIEDGWDEGQEKVLALARHYAAGHVEEHEERVFETSLEAGRLVLEGHSNELAFELLTRSRDVAEDLDIDAEQLGELEALLGDTCTRTGRLELAHAYFEMALENTRESEERAHIYSLRAETFAAERRNDEAWEEHKAVLRTLGVAFPQNLLLQALLALWLWIIFAYRSWTGRGFGKLRGERRRRQEKIAAFLVRSAGVSFLANERLGALLMVLRLLYHTHGLGAHKMTAVAYTGYGFALSFKTGRVRRFSKYLDRGLAIAEQVGDTEMLALCTMHRAITYLFLWPHDPEHRLAQLQRVLPLAKQFCTSIESVVLPVHIGYYLFITGRMKEAAEFFTERSEVAKSLGSRLEVAAGLHNAAMCSSFLGEVNDASDEVREAKRFLQASGQGLHSALFHARECAVMVDRQELGDRLDRHYEAYLENRALIYLTGFYHVIMGYGYLERARLADGDDRRIQLKKLERHLRTLARPPVHMWKWEFYHPHLLVLEAALARERGRRRRATKLLAKAEASATTFANYWGLSAIRRERARLLGDAGDMDGAQREAKRALEIALEQGWGNRIEQLREEFGLEETVVKVVEMEERSTKAEVVSPSPGTVTSETLAAQRSADALLDVSLASSSLDPEEQCRAALDALVRVLGAERAFLFLARENAAMAMQAGRDSEGNDLLPLTGFSSTVVKKVHESGEPMIVTGTEEGEALGSKSAVAHDLRSIMAAPLVLRKRTIGVVYVDSHLAKGLFAQEHVDILRAIASHLAIAVDMSRQAREQNAELERKVEQRTRELRELAASLQQQVVSQTSSLERARSLGRFLPPELVSVVLEGEESMAPRRRQVTAFRLQLRGFERTTAGVEADQLVAMLNGYLSEMTDVAFEHGATLSRFERDSTVGFMGAPTSEGAKSDAKRCARMAKEMFKRAEGVCERWEELLTAAPPVPTMVLCSGAATVGSFGSPRRMDYSAVGDPVDDTERLVRSIKPGQLVCASSTWELIKGPIATTGDKVSYLPPPAQMQLFRLAGAPRTPDPALDETKLAKMSTSPSREEDATPLEPPELKEGVVIADRYELRSSLGSGGMGAVFRAWDRKLELYVALKVLRQELRNDVESLARLHQEVRLARLVSHRNVARIHDIGEWRGLEFISMELVDGRTLAECIQEGATEIDEAVEILRQFCDGLSAAHAAGVIHRDLKPANIMVEPTGRVVILDFGIARPALGGTLTGTDQFVGTAQYMAPEQFLAEKLTSGTDIYALGVVAFEMLTGELPFQGSNPVALAVKHTEALLPDPLDLKPDLPPRLAAVVTQCMAKAPQDRLDSAEAVRALLS